MNEVNRNGTLTLITANTGQYNSSNMIPKQVLDIVDMPNSVHNLSQCYKRQLQLDTLTTDLMSTQIFSNINIDGILVRGK